VSTQWGSVTYGNGLFVATSTNVTAYAMTSPDGITWTVRSIPNPGSWSSVTYGNGLFVAVANNGNFIAATSPDGITWTIRQLPAPPNQYWSSVIYGNGMFVAVSGSGGTASAVAASSPDGITWTARTMPAVANWSSVTYGNGLFVAVSNNGNYLVATSPDGITWTQRSMPISTNWSSVTYGNGLFVAVSSSVNAATSPDGITWTARTLPFAASVVLYANGSFVVIGSGTTGAAYSTDGITWSYRTGALPSTSWASMAYGNGTFVAVSSALGAVFATSTIGYTTLYTAPPGTTGILTDATFVNNTATATTVSVQIDDVDYLPALAVAANNQIAISTRQVIDVGKTVRCYTSSLNLSVHLNGVEIA
jgi:hypothetical protein